MLRSRLRPGDTPKQPSEFQDVESQGFTDKSGNSRKSRFLKTRMCIGIILIFLLFRIDKIYYTWRVQGAHSIVVENALTDTQTMVEGTTKFLTGRVNVNASRELAQSKKTSDAASNSTWRYPLVDRMILQQLEGLGETFNHTDSVTDSRAQWPPRITRLPEDSLQSSSPSFQKVAQEGICETSYHPRPCRFLFPLRIAEQESKARIHFSQIVQLAKHLNRTLVLPNVGKSKIGACFKWGFGTYYDLDYLNGTLGIESYVDLEDFRVWLEIHAQQPRARLSSRLLSVGSSLPLRTAVKGEVYSGENEGIRIYEVEPDEDWKADLPGCMSKFQSLGDAHPSFMLVAQPTRRDRIRSFGDPMATALSDAPVSWDGPSMLEAGVLVLDWNLRHPVFPASYVLGLRYSQQMMDMANRLAPPKQYLVVQWRMETVDLGILKDCAHALVDLLGRLLHEESIISTNVSTVWFASDYPYPIARRTKVQPRPALGAKSGTFKDFDIRHEEAIEILRKAFDERNELDKWKLTDIAEALESRSIEPELVHDSGVLGILDKLISMQATLFVSGSNRCAKRSSYTTQIIESRGTRMREDLQLRNIVDTFG